MSAPLSFLFLCARPATWAPLLQTTSRGPGDTTWTLSPKISGEFDPEHHERSFPPQRATVCPNKDPPTHALVRQPEEVSLENENENENENANGHAAIQEGVVVVLLHHHHHHRRHSTLFIFRHSAPTRRSPFSSLSPVQVGVFGSSSSSSPMVYSKDSCIALMLSPVRVRSFTGFSRVVPIMITACGNSDFPDIQILHEGIPIKIRPPVSWTSLLSPFVAIPQGWRRRYRRRLIHKPTTARPGRC